MVRRRRVDVELAENVLHVLFHGVFGDCERLGNPAIRPASAINWRTSRSRGVNSCRASFPITDETLWQLQALAERGGVLGMMAIPFVVDRAAPTLRRWLDHFDHAVAVMGITHVGLGAEFIDQVTPTERGHGLDEAPNAETVALRKARLALEGFARPEDYPALVSALRERGYDGERLDAILSANWLRILRAALPA